jgi:hypothetical protein
MRTDSLYLTKIAKQYDPDVESVAYEDIKDLGLVYKNPDSNKYYISISRKLPCAIRTMQVFYHELAHVVLFHLGYKRFKGAAEDRELEADVWANKKLGITDECGIIRKGWEECKLCIDKKSEACLAKKANENKKGEFIGLFTGLLICNPQNGQTISYI